MPPRLCVRIINSISLMASQNDSDVRTRMQDNGLFAIRDNLVMHLIRDEMTIEQRIDTFRSLSFDMVASHPKFRESHGLLYLLKILHDCNNPKLQLVIGDVLRTQLGSSDENRKAIFKIVQDAQMLQLLFPGVNSDEFKANAGSAAAACFPLLSGYDTDNKSPDAKSDKQTQGTGLDEVIGWYFSEKEVQRRQGISGKIEKQFAPV